MEFCGFLIILTVLLINVLIVNYVRKLERVSCECAENWKRNYIKYYSLLTIILTSLICIVPILLQLLKINYKIEQVLKNNIISIVSTLYTLFGLVNVYCLFTYSQQIVLGKCDCSRSWERTFIYYYSMLITSLYIFLSALVIIGLVYSGKVNIDVKTLKSLKK